MKEALVTILMIGLILTGCSRTSVQPKPASQPTEQPAVSSTIQDEQKVENNGAQADSKETAPSQVPTPAEQTPQKSQGTTTPVQTQPEPTKAPDTAINITSPSGTYVEAYNVVVKWGDIPGNTTYTVQLFDITDNKQILAETVRGTSLQVGNQVYETGPNGGEWTTYLKENHQVRITVATSANGLRYKSQDKIITVNSLKAKPLSISYPKQGAVLSTADVKNPLTFVVNGPDRPIDYSIGIWDDTDSKWIKNQDGLDKTVSLPPNTLILGHKYKINISCWFSIEDHMRDRPSIGVLNSSFSVAGN